MNKKPLKRLKDRPGEVRDECPSDSGTDRRLHVFSGKHYQARTCTVGPLHTPPTDVPRSHQHVVVSSSRRPCVIHRDRLSQQLMKTVTVLSGFSLSCVSWDIQRDRDTSRERQTDSSRETETHPERQRHIQRDRQTHPERQRHIQRDRDTSRERQTDSSRETETHPERDRQTHPERQRHIQRETETHPERQRHIQRETDRLIQRVY